MTEWAEELACSYVGFLGKSLVSALPLVEPPDSIAGLSRAVKF
jgi:hypothetical protein